MSVQELSTSVCEYNEIRICLELPELPLAVRAASEGFSRTPDLDLYRDVAEHLLACHFGLSFYAADGDFVGFTLFRKLDNILCGGGMMIRPKYQGRGLAKVAILTAKKIMRAEWLAIRTQSPMMWSAANGVAKVLMPNTEGRRNIELVRISMKAAKFLNVDTGTTPGFYGGPLYGVKPVHHDPNLQAWWDGLCSFERGDCVLCVGHF